MQQCRCCEIERAEYDAAHCALWTHFCPGPGPAVSDGRGWPCVFDASLLGASRGLEELPVGARWSDAGDEAAACWLRLAERGVQRRSDFAAQWTIFDM